MISISPADNINQAETAKFLRFPTETFIKYPQSHCIDEKKLTSMEEERSNALEVAAQANEKRKTKKTKKPITSLLFLVFSERLH